MLQLYPGMEYMNTADQEREKRFPGSDFEELGVNIYSWCRSAVRNLEATSSSRHQEELWSKKRDQFFLRLVSGFSFFLLKVRIPGYWAVFKHFKLIYDFFYIFKGVSGQTVKNPQCLSGSFRGTYRQTPGSLLHGSACRGRSDIWECLWELCWADLEFLSGWNGPARWSPSLRPTSAAQWINSRQVVNQHSWHQRTGPLFLYILYIYISHVLRLTSCM